MEFRGFVYKKKLTALTHYYKSLFVEGDRFSPLRLFSFKIFVEIISCPY